MKPTFFVLDLDKQYSRFQVKVRGIVLERVGIAEITKNEKQKYSVPEDFFVGWFLWNLEHDTVFRKHVRSVLKHRDRQAVIELITECLPVAVKR